MPTELRIPSSQRPAFASLLRYDEATMTRLQGALAAVRPALFLGDSTAEVAKATGLEQSEVAQILVMISSLFALREQPETPRDEFVDQVAAAIKADTELTATDDRLETVTSFLRAVLSLDETLGVTSKAWTVARDFERTYCFSRVLTDVRTVFRPTSDDPAAAVVVHNLKIVYHQGEDLNEFFVGLTSKDLVKLKKVIDRAERKEAKLREALTSTKLTLLEVE